MPDGPEPFGFLMFFPDKIPGRSNQETMFIHRLIFIINFTCFWSVVLCGVLIAGLSTSPGMNLARQAGEWAGSRYLTGQVSVGRLEGNLWNRLSFYDLSMTLPDSLGGYEVIGVQEGKVEFRPLNVFRDKPILTNITVDGLKVLYREGVGPRSWDSIGVLFGMDNRFQGESGRPTPVPIPSLRVARGHFKYLDRRDPDDIVRIEARNFFLRGGMTDTDHVSAILETHSVSFLIKGFQDSISTLYADVRRSGDSLSIFDLTLEATAGPHLAFQAHGLLSSIKKRAISLDLTAHGDVGAIGRLIGIDGTLDGQFQLKGSVDNTLNEPIVAARLTSDELFTELGYISDASLNLTYADDLLTIGQYRGGTEAGWVSGEAMLDVSEERHRYRLRIAPSTLSLKALPAGLVGEVSPVAGIATAEMDLQGIGWMDPELKGSASVYTDSLSIDEKELLEFSASAWYDRGQVTIEARSSTGALSAKGRLSLDGKTDLTADLFIPDTGDVTALIGESSSDGLAEMTVLISGEITRPSIWFDGQIVDLVYADIPLGTLMVSGSVDSTLLARVDAYLDTTKIHLSMEAELTGEKAITGRLDLDDLRLKDYIVSDQALGLDARLDLEGRIEGSLQRPLIRGNGLLQDLIVRDENLGNTSMALTLDNRDLSFTLVKPDLSVIADGLVRLEENYPFDIRLDIKRTNLSPLLAIMAKRKIESHAGRFTGKMKAVGFAEYPDLSTITVELDSLILAMDDRELYFAAPSTVHLERQMVTINQLELTGDLGHIMLNGIASLKPGGLVDVEALFEGAQIDFLSPFLLPRGNLRGSADGYFSLTGSPDAPLLNGLFSTTDMQYADQERTNHLGTVSLSVNYQDQMLRFPTLSLETPLGTASARIDYPLDLSWGSPYTPVDEAFNVSLDMDHLAIAPLRNFFPSIPPDLDGTINGHIEVSGPVTHPEDMGGFIVVDSLRLFGLQNELVNEDTLYARFNTAYVDLDTTAITLHRLNQSEDLGRIEAGGRYAFLSQNGTSEESDFTITTSQISMEALLALMGQDLVLSGTLDSDIEISGPGSLRSWDTRFKIDRMAYNEATLDSMEGRLVYEYGDLVIHDFQTWFKDRTLVAYGTIPYDTDGDDGAFERSNVAITVEGEDLDLSFLSGIVYDLERVRGRGDVQLTVGGTPFAPRSVGGIYVQDAEIKLRDFNPPLNASELQFIVDGDEVSMKPVAMKAGDGSIYVFSRIAHENFKLASYEAHATLNQADIELIGSSKLTADGSLSLSGDRQRGQLSGTSLTVSGIVTHPLNLGTLILGTGDVIRPQAAPDPLLEQIALDVEIDVPRLRIRNAMADIEVEGGFALSGTAQNPVVTGNTAALDNGNIVYMDTKFQVETGRMEFLDRKPLESFTSLVDYPVEQTNPEMTILAEATRVRDIYGNEYDVSLNLTGRALQPNLQLTATPSEEGTAELRNQNVLYGPQVVSLLTFGLPGMKADTETFAGIGNRALLMATGSQAEKLLKLDEVRIEGDVLNNNSETGSPAQITISKWVNRRTRVTFTRLFDSSEYQLRVGYQLSNFLFIETFTDQISERPQNGLDLKLKFRFR